MTSCPEAMGWDSWVFWKKQLVEIWDWTKRVGDSNLGETSPVVCCVGWVSELRADAGRTVSIVKIVSFSARVENLEVKKVIKVSYLNQESRQCFAHFRIPMYVNSLHICMFHTFVSWLYYTFTVRHVIWNCLCSTECLILLIWSWMYSGSSFRHALVNFGAFLIFWALA